MSVMRKYKNNIYKSWLETQLKGEFNLSAIRSLERGIARTKCYNEDRCMDNFSEVWEKYREVKHGDLIPINTSKKKKYFHDDKTRFFKSWFYVKEQVNKLKEEAINKQKEKEAVQ